MFLVPVMRKPKHLSRSSDREVAKLGFPLPHYKACFILPCVSGDLTGQAVLCPQQRVKGRGWGMWVSGKPLSPQTLQGTGGEGMASPFRDNVQMPHELGSLFKSSSYQCHTWIHVSQKSPHQSHLPSVSSRSLPLCPPWVPADWTSGRWGPAAQAFWVVDKQTCSQPPK